MIPRKTAISVSTVIVVILASIVMLNFGAVGQVTSGSAGQIGRYSIAVEGEIAYLLDTTTGCVWRRSSQLPFILMSVEGILEVPPHPKDDEATPRKIPERCR